MDAERACSVKTLLHASLIASMIAALLAHTHHRQTRPSQEGEPRTAAPLPPRRLALPLMTMILGATARADPTTRAPAAGFPAAGDGREPPGPGQGTVGDPGSRAGKGGPSPS